uniref:Quinolinate synthase n=1 Tax=Steinernema glaseri TaxID=37863 RepID=A0A1I7YW67_9BILA
MRLPVDSVNLCIASKEIQAAAEEFFENTGPLYNVMIWHTCSPFKQSTVDALIDKFVPVDEGSFYLNGPTRLTRTQLERLVLKCELSNKKLEIQVYPEGATETSKVTNFFDFDKHYSRKIVQEGEVTARREGAQLEVRVGRCRHLDTFNWNWHCP